MSEAKHSRLIILGSGPAGYSAAVYAARANLKPVVDHRHPAWRPAHHHHRSRQLAGRRRRPHRPGADGSACRSTPSASTPRSSTTTSIPPSCSSRPFALKGDSGTYTCDALIIATGASAQYLGLPSEEAFTGKGVSACATCDGFFYRNQVVAVIGGGNTAVEEALYLSNIAKEVHLVHRRDKLRSEKILQDKLFDKVENGNIAPALEPYPGRSAGRPERRNRRTPEETLDGSTSRNWRWPGVFIAIGHKPEYRLFVGQLDMHDGYLKIKGGSEGMPPPPASTGVFAAGDVADHVYRQAITSAGAGCMAALDVEKFLDEQLMDKGGPRSPPLPRLHRQARMLTWLQRDSLEFPATG